MNLMLGDCLEQLKNLPDNSVDSIVTDPPYGLSFMGKSWDYDVPAQNIWEECLRVLRPGGHLLSFFGTRTYHRGVVRIEDAGFEIRDQIMWIYGSGFPKSTDVSKRIDKEAGAEREVVGLAKKSGSNSRAFQSEDKTTAGQHFDSTPSTPEAIQWQGWGTALKPANEPIVVARKPLEKGLTVAQNVLKWGTGALNIDGSRIPTEERLQSGRHLSGRTDPSQSFQYKSRSEYEQSAQGRWPANIIFDEEAAKALDEQSGVLKSGELKGYKAKASENSCMSGKNYAREFTKSTASVGGASRFFYVAKASKAERNAGLEFNDVSLTSHDARPADWENADWKSRGGNFHPTVKPLKLGTHLQNLVTPPGGVTLDPFMGSGSFGVSAKAAGFQFIGIERDEAYFEIAKKRIESAGPVIEEEQDQLEFPA